MGKDGNVSNEEAAEHLSDEAHLDGRRGDLWSGTHPAFADSHAYPFSAVIDLDTGVVLATDPIPEILTVEEILKQVKKANKN